jgi:hypothetical protein
LLDPGQTPRAGARGSRFEGDLAGWSFVPCVGPGAYASRCSACYSASLLAPTRPSAEAAVPPVNPPTASVVTADAGTGRWWLGGGLTGAVDEVVVFDRP